MNQKLHLPAVLTIAIVLVLATASTPSLPSPLPSSAAAAAGSGPAELFCERPKRLRLRRFEDRSAWLKCGPRLIARISVPG